MGKLIVFDGLDGSGKETQSKILEKELLCRGLKVKRIEYPNYKEKSSSLVSLYLNGEIDRDPFSVNAFAAASFYACDHYISYKKNWEKDYKEGFIIIADRYVSSNIIYQMAKLEKKDWEFFLSWICDYEFKKLELPKEDILIYLDVEASITKELINFRNLKKDIHEENLRYLKICEDAAFFLAEKLGWNVLKCYKENGILSIDSISKRVLDLVLNLI